MIWITVPAAPGTSPILWKQRIGDFSGKKCDFYGEKMEILWKQQISTQENGILNRQRKRRAKPGELKQKKKRCKRMSTSSVGGFKFDLDPMTRCGVLGVLGIPWNQP